MVKDYTRKVTHKDYRNPDKLKKYYHRVIKQIYTTPKIYKKTKFSAVEFIDPTTSPEFLEDIKLIYGRNVRIDTESEILKEQTWALNR